MRFLFIGGDPRTRWAMEEIWAAGYDVASWPGDPADKLVLPLPAFRGEHITGGPPLEAIIPLLRPGVTVLGGVLGTHQNTLERTGATIIDYFQDEVLTAANANITAEGAISLVMSKLPVTISGLPVLICGWGRIGQLLAAKLRALGAKVTVQARKKRDLAMIQAMGYGVMPTGQVSSLGIFPVIINTIPAPVYSGRELLGTCEECLLVELASVPGLEHTPLRPVTTAAGLPGIYAPQTAGRLIGRTIMRLVEEESSHFSG